MDFFNNFFKCLQLVYSTHYETGDILDAIAEDYGNGYLTVNNCRSGRSVLWYMDNNRNECYYLDNCEQLSMEEIENELM